MKRRIRNILATAGFFLVGLLIFFGVRRVFGPIDEQAEMRFQGYYREKEDIMDVVFVGNSHIYRYWQSPFAWKQYGMASTQLTISAMSGGVVKATAVEALKTQSPKVVVVDMTVFANTDEDLEDDKSIFRLLDNMKLSKNYLDAVDDYCKFAGITGKDKLMYYLPIIQFHSRWKELGWKDFTEKKSYMNANYQDIWLKNKLGKKAKNPFMKTKAKLGKESSAALEDFLQWCDGQDTEFLFVSVPILHPVREELLNTIADVVREHGYPVVDYNKEASYESLGLVEAEDFSDKNHTNIKGSYKFTLALGKYLMENYDLKDRRGEEGYEEMAETADEYLEIVRDYL